MLKDAAEASFSCSVVIGPVGTPKATSSEAGGTTVAMATLLLPELRHVDAKGA